MTLSHNASPGTLTRTEQKFMLVLVVEHTMSFVYFFGWMCAPFFGIQAG